MDQDKQLSLKFGPPQEPSVDVVKEQHAEVHQLPKVIRSARVLRLPNIAEREQKKVSEREAELLERVLRRAWRF